jgi:type II secretory pathway pseudopilin PulG
MLDRAITIARSLAREERGFTLIELLVSSLTGLVVIGALFTILDVSLHQTSQLTDKVQSDQLGRTAMTHIIDELHSSCISSEFAPIQEKSEADKLVFITAYSKQAVIPSAIKHEILWSKEKDTLTDKYYASSGGSWPSFTFPSSPTSSVQIASNIYPIEENKLLAIFRYYEYAPEATGTSVTPLSAIKTKEFSSTALGATEALKAASVKITFKQAPTDGYEALSRAVTFSDQATLSFSVPKAEDPIHDGPCQ